jgi:hypothetical protein
VFATFRPRPELADPGLVDPVLVLALSGWVDAGWAGAGAADALVDALVDALAGATGDEPGDVSVASVAADADSGRPSEIGVFDVGIDMRQQRPTIDVRGAGVESVRWPRLELHAGRLGRDLLVLRGPEPASGWPAVRDDVVTIARTYGVGLVCCFGGMPAPVTHRGRVTLRTAEAGPALGRAAAPGPAVATFRPRGDYDGPTGLQTVLQDALGATGIPAVALWAQVPPYLTGLPSAPAVRSLLAAFVELSGCDLDMAPFEERDAAYATQVEAYLATRPDLVDLVARLEAMIAETPDDGSSAPDPGDVAELFAEIEDYLQDPDR